MSYRTIPCKICQDDGIPAGRPVRPAIHTCQECSGYYCGECVHKHVQQDSPGRHTLVALSEFLERKIDPGAQHCVGKHPVKSVVEACGKSDNSRSFAPQECPPSVCETLSVSKHSFQDIANCKEELQNCLKKAGVSAEPYQEEITKLKKQRLFVRSKGQEVVNSINKRKQAIIDLWTRIMDETLALVQKSVQAKMDEINELMKVCEDYLSNYLTRFAMGKSLLSLESPEVSDLKKTTADLDILSASPGKLKHVDPLSLVYGNRLDVQDAELSLRDFAGELLDIEEKVLSCPPSGGVADFCHVPGAGLFISGSASRPRSRIWKETNGKLEEEYETGADGLSISSDGKQLFGTLEHLQRVNVFDITESGHLQWNSQIVIKDVKFIQGIDVRADGCLAIADYRAWRVTIHEPDGTLQREVRVGERGQPIFTEPLFVKWATDNSLYVTDRVSIMHVQINPAKVLWKTPVSSAWSVSVLSHSELYVSLRGSRKMISLNTKGQIIHRFKGFGIGAQGVYAAARNRKVLLSFTA